MIALVDCNSFFCSVEKVFHPGLNGKPVCVLSCNDGCIVALTPEAKALGLRRGDPIFKKKDIVQHYGVKLFSTNMYLYAAMSKRVNNILRSAVPHSEVYSIDESFLYLDGLEKYHDLEDYMRGVVEKVRLYTDIPVSVGIAHTKTLAKIGSKFAKQYKGYHSVCMIDNEEKRRKALALFDLSDVWGIGKQTLAKLNYLGIRTPLEFADKKESWVRSHFSKPGWQTWKELNGISCIDTSEVAQRQTIPYGITSDIFKILMFESLGNFLGGSIVLQLEPTQKLFSRKLYNPYTVFYHTFFDLKLVYEVGPESFLPPPTVKSALLNIKRKHLFFDFKFKAKYLAFISCLLEKPDLSVKTALKSIFRKSQVRSISEKFGLNLNAQIVCLSPSQWLNCFLEMLEVVPEKFHPS